MYPENNFAEILCEAQDAKRLKAYLLRKLNSFSGITHSELGDICAMFGLVEESDQE